MNYNIKKEPLFRDMVRIATVVRYEKNQVDDIKNNNVKKFISKKGTASIKNVIIDYLTQIDMKEIKCQ